MPGRAAASNETELVFGFKQLLGAVVLLGLLLGCAYMFGYEKGHRQAAQGKPSPLGFLERRSVMPGKVAEASEILPSASDGQSADAARADPAPTVAARPKPDPADVERSAPRPATVTEPADANPRADAPPPPPSSVPPAAAAPNASETGAAESASGRRLHYQVAAMAKQQNAKALADKLRGQGFEARILTTADDGLFRVCVGPFQNDREAVQARKRLSSSGFQPMARRL